MSVTALCTSAADLPPMNLRARRFWEAVREEERAIERLLDLGAEIRAYVAAAAEARINPPQGADGRAAR